MTGKNIVRVAVVAVAVLLLSAAPTGAQGFEGGPAAGADGAASGFLLQGALSVKTPFVGLGEAALYMDDGVSGDLRLGWMGDALAIVLKSTFNSISDEDSLLGALKFGPLAEFFLWRSGDDSARIYALVGADFGAILTQRDMASDDASFVAGLDLGFGGTYFLHRNFTVGLELGSHTDFYGAEHTTYLSGFFVSAVLGFVAGS